MERLGSVGASEPTNQYCDREMNRAVDQCKSDKYVNIAGSYEETKYAIRMHIERLCREMNDLQTIDATLTPEIFVALKTGKLLERYGLLNR